MGNAPDVPKPANPTDVAGNQQTLNLQAGRESQRGSMVNQVGPQGSLTYSQSGTSPDGTPLYTATTELSEPNKRLLDILQGTQTSAGTGGQSLISGANYGAAQPKDVIGDMTSGWVKDAMNKEVAYLKPQQDYDIDRLDTKLRNQGFAQGDPAYDKAMNALKQSHGQTITGFEASLQPRLWEQAAKAYMMPATLGGTLAGLGAPGTPTFQNTPGLTVQPANLIGATANANDANMKAYDAENKKYGDMMSGLFGIPTSLLGDWAAGGGVQSLLGSAALAGV